MAEDDSTNTIDAPMSTDDMLRQLLEDQKSQRAEVADLRAELSKSRAPVAVAPTSMVQSPEVLAEARQDEIADFEFYCPGCGALYNYQRPCEGRGEAPHPPIEVVPTDEIKGDNNVDPERRAEHTPAPGVAP